MEQKQIHLTEAEWKVMEFLWHKSPRTGRQTTDWMEEHMEWNRSTTLTLLRRLEEKGAVSIGHRGGIKQFRPAIPRKEAVLRETEQFLARIYHGSVSELVETLAREQAISPEEQTALHLIVSRMEEHQNEA